MSKSSLKFPLVSKRAIWSARCEIDDLVYGCVVLLDL